MRVQPKRAQLRASAVRWRLGVAASALIVAAAEPAFAQCNPELDAQSGTAGARLGVACAGTETDQQGDGSNQFVDIAVSGAVTTTAAPAIWLRANNTVVVSGSVEGFYGVRLGDFSGTPSASNVVTVAQGGRIDGISAAAIAGVGSSYLSNQLTLNGAVSGVDFFATGAIADNRIAVGATGRVFVPATRFFDAISLSGSGVRNNTVAISGVVTSTGADPGAIPAGIVLANSGSNALDNNTVTVAAGGSVSSRDSAIVLSSFDLDEESFVVPAGEISRNTVIVNGAISSTANNGVEIANEGTGGSAVVRDNRVTIAGSITTPDGGGVYVAGNGVRNNVVEALAGATIAATAAPGVYFENRGDQTFTGNTVSVGAGATVSANANAIYFIALPIVGTAAVPSADIRSNAITVAGSAISTNSRAVQMFSNAAL
ncbi:MAG: hypothetical protein K2Q06_11375, partial [Parvularculaceae bacterium]|nr:hypothetical protein [Parvularculaceae bacterium]